MSRRECEGLELACLRTTAMGPEQRRFHKRHGPINHVKLDQAYASSEELYAALNRELDREIQEMCECLCTPPGESGA